MKTLRNIVDIEKAHELHAIIQQRKEIEKREKSLKAHFLAMGMPIIHVGDCIITTKECQTTSIDRIALTAEEGEEFLLKYTNVTTYKRLDIVRETA